ncbi:hypothetical protein CHUAL_002115 [Chamberlinius hualienensis]
MAFLCPVRIRRGKRKKDGDKDPMGRAPSIGRITGSASIETLVRVGIEKENGLSPDSKMVVLHDFTPCVDDELEVKRGQMVNVLYQENDWVYVIAADNGQEGFIPHSYCATYGSQLGELALSVKQKKLPRDAESIDTRACSSNVLGGGVRSIREVHSDTESYVGPQSRLHLNSLTNERICANNNNNNNLNLVLPTSATSSSVPTATINTTSNVTSSNNNSSSNVHPFFKDPAGRYVVLYTFIARDENDVSVERGELVTVLNKEDPDWVWIVRSEGQEGFVPSAFVYPANVSQDHIPNADTPSSPPYQNTGGYHGPNSSEAEDLRFHGSELVMLYDYKAQAPDDLSVRRGDWVYADLNNQTVDGWLWAYAPKTRKYGFIPKAYARPPAMTSL